MSTNFYLQPKPACTCCKREYPERHIGKSSGGWCFSLHVYPEEGINTLEDWVALWSDPEAVIKDEYGRVIEQEEMIKWILKRKNWEGNFPKRHTVDEHHCIGHGPDTYDFIVGDFC